MKAASFERLFEEHSQGLFGFLAYRTGDAALAEDLVADVFERVLTARRPRRASEKTWIYTIALTRLPAATNGTGHGHIGALATLNDEEREALSLRYGAGLSLKEIAEVTGAPRSTVEGRLNRGLRALRDARLRFVGAGEASAETGRSMGA